MSRTYIPIELRRLVTHRAEGFCEYCLIHESDTFFGCQVDHIISEKHGGYTEEGNLAYACLVCNRNKGSDVGSLVPETGHYVRFFHPRRDLWSEHFRLNATEMTIVPQSEIGLVTIRILGLNASERILERIALRAIGRYPCPEAVSRMLQGSA